ncbi:MAG: IS110 family transposase [Nitrosomonadaceae bacterium]
MQKYTLFIGIDISKQWFDTCRYDPGQISEPLHKRFTNKQKGFESFVNWLSNQNLLEHNCYICIEHTGIYSLGLARFLHSRQITFVLESGLRINRSIGLQRTKTDQADALAIAQYAARFHQQHKTRSLPMASLIELQALLSLRSRLVRYRHGLTISVNELSACMCDELAKVIQDHNSPVCEQINVQIRKLDQAIGQLIQAQPQLKRIDALVRSVKGIGPIISAHLLVYTNAFTAFDKARALACYIGVVPFKHRSGTSIQRPDRVSFLANRKLKALLSTAAVVAVQHDPQMRSYFNRQLQRNKAPGWIYNAIKNKLIHRVFAVVKRGTPYVVVDQHLA